MQQARIVEILEDKQSVLQAISYNGYFYNVNYVLDYNIDTEDQTVLGCYSIENNCIVDYEFTLNDLLNARELKFYELKEIS